MITPTVGRQVWFYPRDHGAVTKQPWAATICYVHTDRKVNLMVIDPYGSPHPQSAIRLLQDNDKPDADTPYCEWMPYQIGTAERAKQDQTELVQRLVRDALDREFDAGATGGLMLTREEQDQRNHKMLARLEELQRHSAREDGGKITSPNPPGQFKNEDTK